MAKNVNEEYKGYNAGKLLTFGDVVITQAEANPLVFTDPVPTNAVMQNGLDRLSAAKTDAAGGDKFKIIIRKQVEAEVVDLLLERGNYVGLVAGKDLSIVALAGYTPPKQRANRYIEQMDTPTLQIGITRGDVNAETPSQKAMKNITWYITTDATKPLAEWTNFANQGAKFTFPALVTGVTYYICLMGCGPRKQCFTSPIASIVAY
jgi:hypothetical protein